MKNKFVNLISLAMLSLLGFSLLSAPNVVAEENQDEESSVLASISLMPTTAFLQISANSSYDNIMTIRNDGDAETNVEVYATPYSYSYSDSTGLYELGFSNENNFTQVSRWITIKDSNGDFVEKAIFTIPANGELAVTFRVTTPDNIPGGNQYAVLFARTISTSHSSTNGVRAEASPGMVILAHSIDGEAISSAEISDLKIERSVSESGTVRNNFFASAKIKNTGNVDAIAKGELRVEPIIGFGSYETGEKGSSLSVIPEAELILSDEWEDTPSFGLYKATWTVSVGNQTETIEKTIFLISPIFIIIAISLLTIIVFWIIILSRRRKERRSRLAI